MLRCISVTVIACFFFFFLVYVLCVPLAVTYKRIAPQRKVLHAESSRELNRANVSRKRKKPGAGTYTRNRGMCKTRDSKIQRSLTDSLPFSRRSLRLSVLKQTFSLTRWSVVCMYFKKYLKKVKKVKKKCKANVKLTFSLTWIVCTYRKYWNV